MSRAAIQRELRKLVQNFFVFKSNPPLDAKAAGKCPTPKPPPTKAKCGSGSGSYGGVPTGADEEEAAKMRFWKRLSFFGAFPTIGLVAAFVMSGDDEEKKERPPFVKYEHLRLRSKRYPWGDGVKSFFHNPETNALPDGYEN